MWNIVALVLGTFLCVACTAGPATAKLVPGHPMKAVMVKAFDTVVGPLAGVPGWMLRTFVGVTTITGSSGVLVGLYVELFGLMGAGIRWVQALMVCASTGFVGLFFYGGFLDTLLGTFPAPFVLCVLWGFMLVARLQVTPFALFPCAQQMLIEIFVCVVVCVLVIANAVRVINGVSAESLKAEKEVIVKMFKGEEVGKIADVEQPLNVDK